jgi:hypothetical protein
MILNMPSPLNPMTSWSTRVTGEGFFRTFATSDMTNTITGVRGT